MSNDLHKEFVPYQPSLDMKELGFDEPCFSVYDTLGFLQDEKQMDELNLEKISAPTFSQAFRWFRKKYGYWSYFKEATKETCRFYIVKFDEKFYTSEIYNSYPEAELACLIKLIEIVKNK